MSAPNDQPQSAKRGAIIGTAPTWKNTPWADQGLDVLSLNDAYVLGIPRATAWFDLHPIPEMVFRPKGERRVAYQHAPIGGYLRPEGHLNWLKSQLFPVYLHDCREADCANIPAGKRSHDPYPFPTWPNARPFPFQAIQQAMGSYFSSTPAWMLAWMLTEGYRDVYIGGIELSTEWEYIHQRPNLEFLIGMALAQGVTFTFPRKCKLLRGRHTYALEPKPDLGLERTERQIAVLKAEGATGQQRLASLKWYQRSEAADLRARLRVLDLEVADARQEQARLVALSLVA